VPSTAYRVAALGESVSPCQAASPTQQQNAILQLYDATAYNFTPADILRARAIEHRLMEETWLLSVYNLLRALERLRVSTSVIYGDNDLIPNAVREPHRAGDPLS
jgi:hypothetical protein